MKNHFKTMLCLIAASIFFISGLAIGSIPKVVDAKQKQYAEAGELVMQLNGEVKFASDGTATVTFKGLDYTDCEWALSAAKRPHCNIGELPTTMNYETKFHVHGSPGELKMKIINKQKGKVLL